MKKLERYQNSPPEAAANQAARFVRTRLCKLLKTHQPKKSVTFAFDGVAVMAKSAEQRTRRNREWLRALSSCSFGHFCAHLDTPLQLRPIATMHHVQAIVQGWPQQGSHCTICRR